MAKDKKKDFKAPAESPVVSFPPAKKDKKKDKKGK